MCCSVDVSVMSNTLIYVGEGQRDGKLVHVVAYQNKAENMSSKPNAMVLPFPTSVPMNEQNVIDTSKFKSFLTDIAEATKRRRRSAYLGSKGAVAAGSDDDALVFDVGSYTVVLAESVGKIGKALERVPENRRPTISNQFLLGYYKLYPNQPIAVCCWDGSIEAEPLLWWYEPKDTKNFFVPTMDSHDGGAPDINALVYRDHIISTGSTVNDNKDADEVYYTDKLPDNVADLLPQRVFGGKIKRTMTNGDMFIKTGQLPTGNVLVSRGISAEQATSEIRLDGWA